MRILKPPGWKRSKEAPARISTTRLEKTCTGRSGDREFKGEEGMPARAWPFVVAALRGLSQPGDASPGFEGWTLA